MRTTIRMDDDLYRRAKARSAQLGQPVGAFIEEAVRSALRPRRRTGADLPPLTTYGGSGVVPGVDLADSSSLRDLMDEDVPVEAMR